jgi:hypothetical protein
MQAAEIGSRSRLRCRAKFALWSDSFANVAGTTAETVCQFPDPDSDPGLLRLIMRSDRELVLDTVVVGCVSPSNWPHSRRLDVIHRIFDELYSSRKVRRTTKVEPQKLVIQVHPGQLAAQLVSDTDNRRILDLV